MQPLELAHSVSLTDAAKEPLRRKSLGRAEAGCEPQASDLRTERPLRADRSPAAHTATSRHRLPHPRAERSAAMLLSLAARGRSLRAVDASEPMAVSRADGSFSATLAASRARPAGPLRFAALCPGSVELGQPEVGAADQLYVTETRVAIRPARSTPTTAPLSSRVKKPRCPFRPPSRRMYSSPSPGSKPMAAGG